MFCTKCGFKNDDDALFCGGCGSMLSNGQSQTTNEGDTQNSVEETAVDEDISEAGETTILRPEDFPDFPEETEVNEPVQMNVQEPVQPTANEPITENIQGKLAEQSNNTQMTPEQQYMEYQKQHTNPADQQFNNMQNQNAGPQGNMQNQYAGQPNNMQNQYAGQPNNMQNQYMGQQRNMQNQYAGQPNNMQNQYAGQPNNMQNQYARPQGNMQNQFANNQFNARPNQFNSNKPNGNKFSIKRFIFSAIAIIVSILACFSICFNFVGLKMSAMGLSEKFNEKGYKIIKEKPEINDLDLDDDEDNDAAEDMTDHVNMFRYVVIALEAAIVIFAIIDIILLAAVRKKAVYVLTLIFALIKLGLSLIATYIWSFSILDDFKDMVKEQYGGMITSSIKISSVIGAGLIIVFVAEGITILCSIILMTCKDKSKNSIAGY